ncbi:hypothetical protein [Nocardioides bruguierae]|uniref:hypothetical protein n=1 Tax=Nocardioides bruguierae TaxID=2945102 RepID=UPI002020116A|nr:hypothetical protein [Nocardioides bruguierae]MCL8024585.1 hypothetical protein [Nocardioides bruguierae]
MTTTQTGSRASTRTAPTRTSEEDLTVQPDQQPPEQRPAPTRAALLVRRFLLVDLVLLIIGSGAVLTWLLLTRTPDTEPLGDRVSSLVTGRNEVQVRRDEVAEVARTMMTRVNSYGPEDLADDGTMPDYRDGVSSLLTPGFAAEFDDQVQIAEATVAQAGLGRTTTVHAVGVSELADDEATALVAGEFTNTYPGDGDERVSDEPATYRVEVTLRLVDGAWLVDAFSPVTGTGVTTDGSADDGAGADGSTTDGSSTDGGSSR